MTPERYQQIGQLFQEALGLGQEQRKIFLETACAGDEKLQGEVQSLLMAHEQANSFIATFALEIEAVRHDTGPAGGYIGKRIGHYKSLSILGAGGMGEVYLAQDMKLGRKVALKMLPNTITEDSGRLRRFEQEARAASALNHPGIVTIYEIGETEGLHYIAMEFIEGQTLRRKISQGLMDVSEALDTAIQIAGALAEAHSAGIIHRDIKPENLMIRPDGLTKILDFGLAKLTENRPDVDDSKVPTLMQYKTVPGTVIGTVRYMSPEQARGLDVDPRTDIFSFGIVLYEMLTGHVPFEGETPFDLLSSIIDKDPTPISRYVSGLPAELERIIEKSLRKDPDTRYQTARHLQIDLKNLREEMTFEAKSRATSQYPTGQSRKSNIFDEEGEEKPSIAVLPFTNMGRGEECEFFSDGMTEDIISMLAKVKGLRVAARISVFQYKGKNPEISKVGAELKAGAVVEGSVRLSGKRLRVTAELVNVSDGYQLWAERYDRTMEDMFDIQDEISKAIVEALKARLIDKKAQPLGEWKPRPASARTPNFDAHRAYLKGRFYWNQRTWDSLRRGIESFNQAIDADPLYAPAYVGLADSYNLLGYYNERPPEQAYPKAKAAALKALEIDDVIAEAHASLGYTKLFFDWDWVGAEQEFRKAIELNPNYASAHQWLGWYYFSQWRLEEAVSAMRKAHQLDPLAPIINTHLALSLSHAGHHKEAVEQLKQTLELNPMFPLAHQILGSIYLRNNLSDAAVESFRKCVELSEGKIGLGGLGQANALAGKQEEAQKILDQLQAASRERYISPLDLAFVYAGLGETEGAFAWLEQAYRDRTSDLIRLKLHIWPDSLKSDTRFSDLTRRIGL